MSTQETMKKKYQFVEVKNERELNALPDGTRLEWVPGYEEHLQYAPIDLKNDCFLRLWHTFRSTKHGGRRVRIEIKATLNRFRHDRDKLRPRVTFKFMMEGKIKYLFRSHVTMRCLTGFAITDPRHWVVDHEDGNTLNDRPSNLQVISQRENCLRSKRYRETRKLSPRAKKLSAEQRQHWMDERRRQLMAIHPDADANDIEFELAIDIQEHFG